MKIAPKHGALLLASLVAVAAAAYLLGRQHAPEPAEGPVAVESQPRAGGEAEAAASPHSEVGIPNFVQFQIGQRNVKSVLVDGDVAWIGTSGGLVRYVPERKEHRIYDNRSGLLSNGVFYVGRMGDEIWAGTYGGGLSVLRPESGQWRNYNIPHGLADAFVYDALRTRDGDVWIATWSGANRILDGKLDQVESWRLYTVENTQGGLPNDWVYGLAEGKDGEIWLATEGGLARFADGAWTNWSHEDGLGAAYEAVAGDIQFQNDPGEFSAHHARQKQEQGLGDITVAYNPNYIVSLAVDEAGVVWAGTWGAGLSRFDGRTWRTYTHDQGLPSNHVFAIEIDADGDLLVGTSRGLARFDGETFTAFGRKDGLFSDTVFAIGVGRDSSLWVGSFGGVAWFPDGLNRPLAVQ